jgi:hypothetical protein
MFKRLIFFLFLFFGLFEIGFSVVSTFSCMTIDEAALDGDRKVILTADILNSVANPSCFVLDTDSFEFDCQGYIVDGVDTNWRSGFSFDSGFSLYNITLKNCIVSDWSYGINLRSFASNNYFSNLTFNSNLYGFQADSFVNNNLLEDSNFNFNSYSLHIYSSPKNNIFKNLLINNSYIGIYLDFTPKNNSFENISIYNSSLYEIEIYVPGLNSHINNTFKNSYLGNWSKINSNDWNDTPTYFYGNSYLIGTNPGGCFDPDFNLSCEGVLPPVITFLDDSVTSSSNLAGIGDLSIIFGVGLISLFLLFI